MRTAQNSRPLLRRFPLRPCCLFARARAKAFAHAAVLATTLEGVAYAHAAGAMLPIRSAFLFTSGAVMPASAATSLRQFDCPPFRHAVRRQAPMLPYVLPQTRGRDESATCAPGEPPSVTLAAAR